jgi:hypothetical protein
VPWRTIGGGGGGTGGGNGGGCRHPSCGGHVGRVVVVDWLKMVEEVVEEENSTWSHDF